MDYNIIFTKLNILENQQEYFNHNQIGGYEELKNNQIIELWQNPDYNNNFINFYILVNKYLRGINLDIKEEWLKTLKLNSKKDFTEFMIYYINKLTNIIYKNPSTKKEIFFRGEHRENFYYEIGDTLFYSTFQSVSSSISTAFKFSQGYDKGIKILFVIEFPENSYYKMLTTKLKIYNYKQHITEIIDEKEFLVMPNTYYVIVDKFTIFNNTNIVKLKLLTQTYYEIKNNELYQKEAFELNSKAIKNFNSVELTKFIKLSNEYEKMINSLNLLSLYNINIDFYDELNNTNSDNLFSLDIELINKLILQIDDYNFKEIMNEIKNNGLGYYNNELKNIPKYKERIRRINLIINTDFKEIKKLTIFCGYYNYNNLFKKPDFINYLKKQKINEEFEYNKILKGCLSINKFLYDDINNLDYPHKKIKKNNTTKLVYYNVIIEMNIINTKMCICSEHQTQNENNVILIPNFKMKITKIKKETNKYNLPYIYYEITIVNK